MRLDVYYYHSLNQIDGIQGVKVIFLYENGVVLDCFSIVHEI